MNILITGASGFIGSHITNALINDGHIITLCLRNPERVTGKWPDTKIVQADFSKDHEVSVWVPRLEGIDIVINAVGIIRQTWLQNFHDLHTKAPCALFKACEKKNIKVIQISALGADDTASSQYHLTKRAADECLMNLDVKWGILMPSIVYGPGSKSMALFSALAALPVIPVFKRGVQLVQPVHIADLVKVVRKIISSDKYDRQKIELAGPEPVTIKQLYMKMRNWLGLGKARFLTLPYYFMIFIGCISEFISNAPVTKETIEMLQKGSISDVSIFIRQFGFKPVHLDCALRDQPAQQSDCWYARLYFLRPLLRISIAFIWVYTGYISAFVYPVEQSFKMLAKAGVAESFSPVMLYGAAAIDCLLGIATMVNYRISIIGVFQIYLIVLYTVIITFTQPEQWLHPFGPVSKNIPLLAAILVMMVLERK